MKLYTGVLLGLMIGQVSRSPIWLNTENLAKMRPIQTLAAGDSCALLDATVFAGAAPSLKDLRLKTADSELPYTILVSETADTLVEAALLLNVHSLPDRLAFDLAMPQRLYTAVELDIHQQNFLWTAAVSGTNDLNVGPRTPLGLFTIFDFTPRHLARSTILPLQESAFRYLHVELHGSRIDPAAIRGAAVPPSREAQTLYTTTAQTMVLEQRGSETVATFHVPAHVPIERTSVDLSPGSSGNFSRLVRVTGRSGRDLPPETVVGTISRLHLGNINQSQNSFPAAMGVNLQHDAIVEVAIENGSSRPLPVSSIRLEMRQRTLCFSAPQGPIALFYGDLSPPAPHIPTYISPQRSLSATLGPEIPNPAFQPDRSAKTRPSSHIDRWGLLLLATLGTGVTIILHTLRKHRR